MRNRYEGPYVVKRLMNGGVSYVVENDDKILRVHHSHLKLYAEPPTYLKDYLMIDIKTTNSELINVYSNENVSRLRKSVYADFTPINDISDSDSSDMSSDLIMTKKNMKSGKIQILEKDIMFTFIGSKVDKATQTESAVTNICTQTECETRKNDFVSSANCINNLDISDEKTTTDVKSNSGTEILTDDDFDAGISNLDTSDSRWQYQLCEDYEGSWLSNDNDQHSRDGSTIWNENMVFKKGGLSMTVRWVDLNERREDQVLRMSTSGTVNLKELTKYEKMDSSKERCKVDSQIKRKSLYSNGSFRTEETEQARTVKDEKFSILTRSKGKAPEYQNVQERAIEYLSCRKVHK